MYLVRDITKCIMAYNQEGYFCHFFCCGGDSQICMGITKVSVMPELVELGAWSSASRFICHCGAESKFTFRI